jgi:formamidopyrimidine-DNA glycosylase
MPELPEVETTVRALAPHVTGRRIIEARFFHSRILRGAPSPELAGKVIRAVRRHGKHILFDLGQDTLAIHLGMTGRLLVGAEVGPHTRALLVLDGVQVCFDDPRMFGRVQMNPSGLGRLGPEPLEVSLDEFRRRLAGRRTRIKALLLDQTFLRGVGNIYADESLFRAGIHPRAIATRLGEARAQRLYTAIREVLQEAIASGGSSISDYVDAEGRRGWFQFSHRVYQKDGEPCPRCGATIRRILVAQRGTHYCPKCQRV